MNNTSKARELTQTLEQVAIEARNRFMHNYAVLTFSDLKSIVDDMPGAWGHVNGRPLTPDQKQDYRSAVQELARIGVEARRGGVELCTVSL